MASSGAGQDRRPVQCCVLQFTVQQCLPHLGDGEKETRHELPGIQPHLRSGRNLRTNLAQTRAGFAGGNCVVAEEIGAPTVPVGVVHGTNPGRGHVDGDGGCLLLFRISYRLTNGFDLFKVHQH